MYKWCINEMLHKMNKRCSIISAPNRLLTFVFFQPTANERLDGLKNSPHNGPGTPREDGGSGNGEMGYGSQIHYNQEGMTPVGHYKLIYLNQANYKKTDILYDRIIANLQKF